MLKDFLEGLVGFVTFVVLTLLFLVGGVIGFFATMFLITPIPGCPRNIETLIAAIIGWVVFGFGLHKFVDVMSRPCQCQGSELCQHQPCQHHK